MLKNDKEEDEYSQKKENILYLGDNDDSKYFNIKNYFGDLNVLNKYPKNKTKNEENSSENIDTKLNNLNEHVHPEPPKDAPEGIDTMVNESSSLLIILFIFSLLLLFS